MYDVAKQEISLIFGGTSIERELSLRAFHNIYSELQLVGYQTHQYKNVYYIEEDGMVLKKPFNINKEPDYYIQKHGKAFLPIDVFRSIQVNGEYLFSLLYGHYGEDGHYQGLANSLGIKSSFGSVLSCSLTKSKYHCSKYIEATYPEFEPLPTIAIKSQDLPNLKTKLINFYNQEIVIKPNALGSSLMTNRFYLNENSLDAIDTLLKTILKHDNMALIQKYIAGEEYSCGCITNQNTITVLPLVRIRTKNCFQGRSEKLCKFGVSERLLESSYNAYTSKIADVTKRIFEDLKFQNMFRMDFIISGTKIYFLEINPLPGLTSTSLFPKMLQGINLSLASFIELTLKNSFIGNT